MVLLIRLVVLVAKQFGPGPIIMVIGLAALVLGLEQRQLAQQLATPPQEIALGDLIAHGPGDNRHIVLKDFTLAGDTCAIHEKEGGLVAWVPLVPTGEQPEAVGGMVRVRGLEPTARASLF